MAGDELGRSDPGTPGLDENLERRMLELGGSRDVVDVVSVTVRPAVTAG
jgi:hypothetical protein